MALTTCDARPSRLIPTISSSLWGAVILAGCALPTRSAAALPPGSETRLPYLDARSSVAEYHGPGREDPPPEEVPEVRIGWFGPADPNHPTAGLMWLAATMAVDEANQAGGYRGVPFRLLSAWSENPWDTGITGIVRLVYEEGVWAVAGAPDGPAAHLVAQVVAKARLTFLSSVSTDPTTNLASVPWVFSCAPSDAVQAPVLAQALASCCREKSFALVSGTDHDSRVLSTELLAALAALRMFPTTHLELVPGAAGLENHMRILQSARPTAVAVVATPAESARFVVALRNDGLDMPVIGGPALSRRAFVDGTGCRAEGVVFPLLWDSSSNAGGDGFAGRFRDRYGREADYTAAYTYDALQFLIAGIREAGLNRARIRDAVRELSPQVGVTGTIAWDPSGRNRKAVDLGTIRGGEVKDNNALE